MAQGSAVDALSAAGREARDRRIREALAFRPLSVHLGLDLVPLVDPEIGGDFMERLGRLRIAMAAETGFVFPGVALADDRQAAPQGYRIQVYDQVAGTGELLMGLWFATAREGTYPSPPVGLPGRDPHSGRPGVWLPAGGYDAAQAEGFVLRTPVKVLTDHLEAVIRSHAARLLSLEEVRLMLDALGESAPALARTVVPDCFTLAEMAQLLGLALTRGVCIRDLAGAVERLVASRREDPAATPEALADGLARDPPGSRFPPPDLPHATATPEEVIRATLAPPPFVVELGPDLAASADPAIKGDLLEGVADMRGQVYRELGVVLPGILFRQDAGLCEGEYTIAIRGRVVATGMVWPDPAASSAERLLACIAEAGRAHGAELLDLEETGRLLERARDCDPDLPDLPGGAFARADLQRFLRAVVRGGGDLADPARLVRQFARAGAPAESPDAGARPLESAGPTEHPPSWPASLRDRLRAAAANPDRSAPAHLAAVAVSECHSLISQLHDSEAAERLTEAEAEIAGLGGTAAAEGEVARARGRLALAKCLLFTWDGRLAAGLDAAELAMSTAADPAQARAAAVGAHTICAELLRGAGKGPWAWACAARAAEEFAALLDVANAWSDREAAAQAHLLVDLEMAAVPARLLALRGEALLARGEGAHAARHLEAAAADLGRRSCDGREDLHAAHVATLRALAEARMAAGLAAGAAAIGQDLHAARDRLRHS
ncbi:MAG: FHIPEP family type III secretion protein, partial [Candidatus Sericytochromatia bacterium]|nr:FHIPEP family type III secretion protein [Candidatus Tanganyikabacteria bacterium]